MLGMSRKERPNIPPERMGRPNGDDNGALDRNGDKGLEFNNEKY